MIGNFARMVTSERTAPWRSTMRAAMCSARSSTWRASPITTWSMHSATVSGKRDMCTPFWPRIEVDEAVDLGVVQKLGAGMGDPDHLVDAGDPGASQREVDVGLGGLQVMGKG